MRPARSPARLGSPISLALVAALATGCEAEPEPQPDPYPRMLVDVTAFELDDPSDPSDPGADPFDDRPAEVVCPAEVGMAIEELSGEPSLSVDTQACNYLSAVQPSLVEAHAGELLHLRVWHFELDAAEPAEAHLALMIGEDLVWERWLPIPSPSELIEERVELSADYPAGAAVRLHLHNHGFNSYNLLTVELEPG